LAKRITGCGWAYEVIEGLDDAIHRHVYGQQSALEDGETTLEARSKRPLEDCVENKAEKFDHLTPTAFNTYSRYKNDGPEDFLRYAKEGEHSPRPKIIVVDMAWRFHDQIMPENATFLSKECEDINAYRCTSWPSRHGNDETNPLLIPRKTKVYDPERGAYVETERRRLIDHGAACVAALRISDRTPAQRKMILGYRGDPNCDATKEANLWNLSPRADILLLPIRRHTKIDLPAYENALRMAEENNFIDDREHSAFRDNWSYQLISKAVERDASKTAAGLLSMAFECWEEEMAKLSPKNGSSNDYTCEPLLTLIIQNYKEQPNDESADDARSTLEFIASDTIRKLITSLLTTFEEAGFTETMSLIEEAASGPHPKIGRGDTIVIPQQIEIWNEEVGHNLQDVLHHPGIKLSAKDFFKDRSTRGTPVSSPPESRLGTSATPDPNDMRLDIDQVKCIELPVIAYRAVEKIVETLTCKYQISVIASGGNSHIDLGQICIQKLDKYLPTKRFDDLPENEDERKEYIDRQRRRLFEARGTYCGAIIVGSGIVELARYWLDPLSRRYSRDHEDEQEQDSKSHRVERHHTLLRKSLEGGSSNQTHRNHFSNFGLAVNASGRCSATEIFHTSNKVVADQSYHHWFGASIASMVAAACLANVQQIRQMKDYLNKIQFADGTLEKKQRTLFPLKPFEARAHFEQWRSNDCYFYDCLEDLMGAPPDIRAWFEGSCYFDVLKPHRDRGIERINQLTIDEDER